MCCPGEVAVRCLLDAVTTGVFVLLVGLATEVGNAYACLIVGVGLES